MAKQVRLVSPTSEIQDKNGPPWAGEYASFTPRGRFRFKYSMLTPPLLLSTTRRILSPIFAILGGAAWFTLTALSSHLALWWIGVVAAPLVMAVVLLAMGATVYREQLKNPTFPVGVPAQSFVDEQSIWIRRSVGSREFPKHEIVRVRRAMGFAVIATSASGSFVVPGALVPK